MKLFKMVLKGLLVGGCGLLPEAMCACAWREDLSETVFE